MLTNWPSTGYNRQQQAILTRVILQPRSLLRGCGDYGLALNSYREAGMRTRKTCSLLRESDVLNGSKEKVLNCADNWNQDSDYERNKHIILRMIQKTTLNINRKFCFWFDDLVSQCLCPQISFQVQKPPEFQIQDIQYLEIGSFIGVGNIPLPPVKTDESFLGKMGVGVTKAMEPLVQNFKANPEHSEKAADLVRAQILGMLSSSSPWTIINTTGEETGISGSIPDDAKWRSWMLK